MSYLDNTSSLKAFIGLYPAGSKVLETYFGSSLTKLRGLGANFGSNPARSKHLGPVSPIKFTSKSG